LQDIARLDRSGSGDDAASLLKEVAMVSTACKLNGRRCWCAKELRERCWRHSDGKRCLAGTKQHCVLVQQLSLNAGA